MTLIYVLSLAFIAGFLGTCVMTVGQEIDLRFFSKRPISFSPAIGFSRVMRIDFDSLNRSKQILLSYLVHLAYGTLWGFPLALCYYFDISTTLETGL